MLQGAIDLILVPGSSLKLVPVINLSVLCLLIVLCCLTYSKIASIHLIVMSALALGLLASVNWYMASFCSCIVSTLYSTPIAHFSRCCLRFVYEFNRIKASSENSENSTTDEGIQASAKKTD